MKMLLPMTKRQIKEINALYEQDGKCSLCLADFLGIETKLLVAQPGSHESFSHAGSIKVDSVCNDCFLVIAESMIRIKKEKP